MILMISVFDLFRVGIGPSSSHTSGPMRAAKAFTDDLLVRGLIDSVTTIVVDLFGSLAATGRGHGTDNAVMLGLQGEQPELIDVQTMEERVRAIRGDQRLCLAHRRTIVFEEARHLLFHPGESLPEHPNGVRFTATDGSGVTLLSSEYYSIGGGFIVGPGHPRRTMDDAPVPFPFRTAKELIAFGEAADLTIAQIVTANEQALDPERDVKGGLLAIWRVMQESVQRGLETTGTLPGSLHVKRRAQKLAAHLKEARAADPLQILDWVSVWAMAVNEENAAGHRVVTAPTNGASGLIPAVLHYVKTFVRGAGDDEICEFLLTAGSVGLLAKANASISGAEVGCQGEVGVACAMAAAGLVAALGGTNEQMEHAAEIGIEHHLGMTCDPVGGLVQIPCIERNAVGAVKAIHAARLAMNTDGGHNVSLDQAIETMRQTGRDMQSAYKETSQAGLAVNVIAC
jgi:L-serine dehydratase